MFSVLGIALAFVSVQRGLLVGLKGCLLHVTREFYSIKLICRNLYAIFFTCEKSLYSQSEWRTAVFHM